MKRVAQGAILAALAAVPIGAVGLGPLSDEQVIDGPSRGFSLTLMNPYREPVEFRTYAVGSDDELPQVRVDIVPSVVTLGAGLSRRVLVIANDLTVGENYRFRVCAERAAPQSGVHINARVCSNLTAHRIR